MRESERMRLRKGERGGREKRKDKEGRDKKSDNVGVLFMGLHVTGPHWQECKEPWYRATHERHCLYSQGL